MLVGLAKRVAERVGPVVQLRRAGEGPEMAFLVVAVISYTAASETADKPACIAVVVVPLVPFTEKEVAEVASACEVVTAFSKDNIAGLSA